MRTGRRISPLLAVAAIAVVASGCATVRPMPLAGKEPLDTGRESVALMTVKTANEYKPGWQPKVVAVFVREEEGEKKTYSFRVHDPDRQVDEQFNEYLVSMGLAPGKYKLIEIRGLNRKFPISALSSVPIYTRFEIKSNSMIYLGRVEAIIRERKDDSELRAGPVIPLIDQAVAGFSGGTFHVQILDNYDADLAFFREKYPALATFTVERAVLPAWKKPSDEDMK